MTPEERLRRRRELVAEVIADLQAGLSAEDRDLIVRYMVLRALGRCAPAEPPVRAPRSRRPSIHRRPVRRSHAR